jgi:superfamily II DNA or RNA helicase
MFWKPLTSADFSERFNQTQELLIKRFEQELNLLNGKTLRRQYQPNAIMQLLAGAYGAGGAQTTHIGCGGGKSLIFTLAAITALFDGKAKKIVVTAPTIVLCRQLENEFIRLIGQILEAKGAKPKQPLRVVNVSSDGQAKVKDLSKEELEEEHADYSEIDEEAQRASAELASRLSIDQFTTMDHERLEGYISDARPTLFFVCKPSFIKNFSQRVIKTGCKIDITIFDEYHNFISQNNEQNKRLLEQYSFFSHSRWFFSASKKAGKLFSWFDPVFGTEVCDVKSSQLVEWGYLVPHLKVFFITAGQIKGITEAIKDYFKAKKIKNAERFFREMAVILAVMHHQIKLSTPQGIMFGSSVAFIREMMQCEEFKEELNKLLANLKLFSIVGSTPKDERDDIFKQLRAATDDMATFLLNHSVIKEGVDVTKFNMALITRSMSEFALQQALGRIQRVYAGKTTAYLYLYIDSDDSGIIKDKMYDLAMKLHYNIGDLEVVYEDMFDEKVGKPDDEDAQEYLNIDGVKIPLLKTDVPIAEAVKNHIEQSKKDAEYAARRKVYDNMTTAKKLFALGA